ncbi:MAG: hypothetical protein ACRES9_06295 [Gammaproteobacteria bacterium]
MYQAIMRDARFPLVAVIGGLVSIGLFLFLHQLIVTSARSEAPPPIFQTIGTVKLQRQPQIIRKIPPPPQPPVMRKQPKTFNPRPVPTQNPIDRPNLTLTLGPVGPGNPIIGNQPSETSVEGDGSQMLGAKIRVKPLYPPQAAMQGVEGSVNLLHGRLRRVGGKSACGWSQFAASPAPVGPGRFADNHAMEVLSAEGERQSRGNAQRLSRHQVYAALSGDRDRRSMG